MLLVWFELPDRPEMLKYFIDMADEIEFIHLWFNHPSERDTDLSPFERIYWLDYATPYALLDAVRPDKILGEYLRDLKGVALTAAAKNRGIPVLGLTHGIYFEDSYDLVLDRPRYPFTLFTLWKYLRIALFYLSILTRLKNWKHFGPLAKYFILFFIRGYYEAGKAVRFDFRNPDVYFVYQMANATEWLGLHHDLRRDQIVPIGVLNFDNMLQSVPKLLPNSTNDYYLLIDTAWIYQEDIPEQSIIDAIYTRLADYAASQGKDLYVKLHPHWYHNQSLPLRPNIKYLRALDEDTLNRTIANAAGCFCNISTLAVPVIYFKPTYLLYYKRMIGDVRYFAESGMCRVLDIATFLPSDIHFENFVRSEEQVAGFVDKYLYSADGHATDRLKAHILA